MTYQHMKNALLVLLIFVAFFLNRPLPAHASGSLVVNNRHHGGGYTEVMVSGDRYYYDRGIFYTGSPGNYVVVEAPEGAVVYDVPTGYEQVIIEGHPYYRYHNVYYRPLHGRYEVVRIKERGDREKDFDRREDHHHGHR